jgi:hypothetical protein
MSAPTSVFTIAAVARIREMKLAGASYAQIAAAIGSKSANAVKARCCQLGINHPEHTEIAA